MCASCPLATRPLKAYAATLIRKTPRGEQIDNSECVVCLNKKKSNLIPIPPPVVAPFARQNQFTDFVHQPYAFRLAHGNNTPDTTTQVAVRGGALVPKRSRVIRVCRFGRVCVSAPGRATLTTTTTTNQQQREPSHPDCTSVCCF